MDKVKEETKCEFYNNYECNAYYDIYPEPEDCQRDLCRTHEDCYYRQLKRLQTENEELRQIRKDTTDIQQPYVIMYRNLKKELHNLQAENEQLKQTLQEIKEIAEKDFRHTAWEEYARQLKEIITKINEVIGAE